MGEVITAQPRMIVLSIKCDNAHNKQPDVG